MVVLTEISVEHARVIQTYLDGLSLDSPVCPLTMADVTTLLREVASDVTSHSMKKGALTALAAEVGLSTWALLHRAQQMSASLVRAPLTS